MRLFADLMMTEKKGAKRLDSRFTKLVARKNGIYNACIHGAFVIRFCSLERKNDRDEAKRNRGYSCVRR